MPKPIPHGLDKRPYLASPGYLLAMAPRRARWGVWRAWFTWRAYCDSRRCGWSVWYSIRRALRRPLSGATYR